MDISGEPQVCFDVHSFIWQRLSDHAVSPLQFLETMQLKYNQQAQDNEVHIVGSCAFDSIPADLGTLFARETFPGVFSISLSLCYCYHYFP